MNKKVPFSRDKVTRQLMTPATTLWDSHLRFSGANLCDRVMVTRSKGSKTPRYTQDLEMDAEPENLWARQLRLEKKPPRLVVLPIFMRGKTTPWKMEVGRHDQTRGEINRPD